MENNQAETVERRNHGSSMINKLGIFMTMSMGGVAGYFASDTITGFCGASIPGPALGKLAVWLGVTVEPSTPLSWVIGCTVVGCITGLIAIKAVRAGVYRA
jgi:hypothetical protein